MTISWLSKHANLVAASVYKAEIQALFKECKEAIQLKRSS